MTNFKPTYLYIKTHQITGLKYFGKTTNDPYRYYGSGIYWLRHLREHGYKIDTEVIGLFHNYNECKEFAINFSIKENIVESSNWANLRIENGLDGGDTGRTNYTPLSTETRIKISEKNKGKSPYNKGTKGLCPGNKSPRTEETKQKLRKANLGKKRSQESIDKQQMTRARNKSIFTDEEAIDIARMRR